MSLRRDLSGFHRLHDARTTLKPRSDEPRHNPAGDKDLRRRVDYFGHTPPFPVMLANFFIVTRLVNFFDLRAGRLPSGPGSMASAFAALRRDATEPSPRLRSGSVSAHAGCDP
jgi:hypothetical protein